MRTLYLSHNGMTEPLGQAQVLPYLVGLARRGVEVEIVSFERAGTTPEAIDAVRGALVAEGIGWRPLVRSPSHSLGRKAFEIGQASLRGLAMALERRPDIVHARSHLPAVAADLIARAAPGARLLFDVRGLLGDEYVDGGNWTRDSLRYRLVKRYERHLFRSARGVVVLTEALRRWMRAEGAVPAATPIEVVPCCVDTGRFGVDPEARVRMRRELGLGERPVVVYSGTLGSWYRAGEMARFVGALGRLRKGVAWLVLTQSDPSELRAAARSHGLGEADLVVRAMPPASMPAALAAGDLGLSFIQPCFSKMGSSPTKVAEYLASGLVAVVNDGVGDQGELGAEPGACVVLPSLEPDAVDAAAARASALLDGPSAARAATCRSAAVARFSLADLGVPRYLALYRALCGAAASSR